MDKLSVLKRYFGHASFRIGQECLIDALVDGRDVLGIMPTGAGKSMCYQIPALLLNGITIVISPLISLMKDQVAALTQMGIAAAFINSSLSGAQCRQVLQRAAKERYKIIYVAPERLSAEDFLQFALLAHIPLIAVDEAHCVSQWGQDFRPSYLKIAAFIAKLPLRPAVGAFTATATEDVKEDIIRLLKLKKPHIQTTGFDRPNLRFEVIKTKDKSAYIHSYLLRHTEKSGIVYCATRKAVDSLCNELLQKGIAATRYHAGLDDYERLHNQEEFVYDRARVMVATNAFGMGIDKSNVSFVIHNNMPKNMESYYQEAGRAGRDGSDAECILLFSNGDVQTQRYFIENAQENEELSEEERRAVYMRDMKRLQKMTNYCKTNTCLRAYILNYFGENNAGECGNCGNCINEYIKQDITIDAQKILSAVARVERKYANSLGITQIVRMLHGSRDQRILQLKLDALPTYGIMRNTPRQTIREYIEQLIAQGYIAITEDEYPVLHLTALAPEVLFSGKRVSMAVLAEQVADDIARKKPAKHRESAINREPDEVLLAALKDLRKKLAIKAGVPAYIIFSNATLVDMASKKPNTLPAFLEVSGVGLVKTARYGKAFLSLIQEYEQA
ncbi:MAG: DNA helicase RecQ [Firmicutes bacterium]|nr:DNA helicase RecQ [Bacillota bacterium]